MTAKLIFLTDRTIEGCIFQKIQLSAVLHRRRNCCLPFTHTNTRESNDHHRDNALPTGDVKPNARLNECFVRFLDRMRCCYFQDQMVRLTRILCIHINEYYHLICRQRSTRSLGTTRVSYSFLLYFSLWCFVYFICFLF